MAAWLGDSGSSSFPMQNNSRNSSEGGLTKNIDGDIHYEPFVESFVYFQVRDKRRAAESAVTSDSKLTSKDDFKDKQGKTLP